MSWDKPTSYSAICTAPWLWAAKVFSSTNNSAICTNPQLWVLQVFSSNIEQYQLHRHAIMSSAGALIKQQKGPSTPLHSCGCCRCFHQPQTVQSAPPYSCGRRRCSHQTATVPPHRPTVVAMKLHSANSKHCRLHNPTVVGAEGGLVQQQTNAICTTYWLWTLQPFSQNSKQGPRHCPRLCALLVFSSKSKQCHLHRLTAVGTAVVLIKQQTGPTAPHHCCGRFRCSHQKQTSNSATCTALQLWALQVFSSNSKPCNLHRAKVVCAVGVLIK